jgi:hypothetical protein
MIHYETVGVNGFWPERAPCCRLPEGSPRPSFTQTFVRTGVMPRFQYSGWRPGQPILDLSLAEQRARAVERPIPREFVLGEGYSRRQIHSLLGGGLQEYLPHSGGVVVCGCFRRDRNPRAPRVVLPSAGPRTQQWARVLAAQATAIPVFVKEEPGDSSLWIYHGWYRSVGIDEDPRRVAEACQEGHRRNVPFLLYLEPANAQAPG